jgi:RNA polymerase-binding transcription factor DksA
MAKTRLCERCKAPIPAERIAAVPGSRLCVKCSQVTGGDTTITAADENLAKKESMKKNYGAVSVRVVRKNRRD